VDAHSTPIVQGSPRGLPVPTHTSVLWLHVPLTQSSAALQRLPTLPSVQNTTPQYPDVQLAPVEQVDPTAPSEHSLKWHCIEPLQSASASQLEPSMPSEHTCRPQIPDAQFAFVVQGAPRPSCTQAPDTQWPRSHCASSVHGAPGPPLVHVPAVQLFDSHWSLSVHGLPPGAGRQKPGSTPAGSTQFRLMHWMS
jgi:hypothetical protein